MILLEDANRGGEKQVMQMWKEEYSKDFKIYAETPGVCYDGDYFESDLLKLKMFINITGNQY